MRERLHSRPAGRPKDVCLAQPLAPEKRCLARWLGEEDSNPH